MVEIQCSSCHTRYRIDERVLPDETPTFKCSRCGHVFSVEPRKPKTDEAPATPKATEPKPAPRRTRTLPIAEPRASAESEARESSPRSSEPRARRALKIVAPPARASDVPQPAVAAPTRDPAPEPAPEARPIAPEAEPESADPLDRPFSHRVEEPEPTDNLSFDFSAETEEHQLEPEEPEHEEEEKWEVGESGLDFAGPDDDHRVSLEEEPPDPPAPPPLRAISRRARDHEVDDDEDRAPSPGRALHSYGFFLACFFFTALGFGALSLLIAGLPVGSAALLAGLPVVGGHFVNPVSAAVQIALREVHADYQKLNGGRAALVITGEALNVGSQPLHQVQIAASLLDGSQHGIAKQEVFCGNSLSGRMIGQMTARELDFFEKLGPPRSFVLPPSGSSAFAIVFVAPPAGAGGLAIEVAQATPSGPDDAAAAAHAP
jgi:predicted Zn finger-like uncharacterized protein